MARSPIPKKAIRSRTSKKKSKSLSWFWVFFVLAFLSIVGFYKFRKELKTYFYAQSTGTYQADKRSKARIDSVLENHKNRAFGIDVSQYQGVINWEDVVKDTTEIPLTFVFVRATAGNDKEDQLFDENWQQLKDKNLIRGAYHYYRPNENSLDQAKNFIKTVQLHKGDLPPVLDIEQLPKNQSVDSLKKGLQRWLDRVESHYGVQPIIYSGEKYYTDFLKKEFSKYTFWVANYNEWVGTIKEDWAFWQFTEKAAIPGISERVDLNIYNGTPKMLRYLTKRD